jgi:diaminopimelate decarboxylase
MTDNNQQYPLTFSSDLQLAEIAKKFGTPILVHDEKSYIRYGNEALAVPNAFGVTIRYAMKANSHSAILRLFDRMGIAIDASSFYEVKRALSAGIAPDKIKLTGQEVLSTERMMELVNLGVHINCTSLTQLKLFAQNMSGSNHTISVRINPGLGSGHNNRTNTAGPAASFGIWHDYIPQIQNIAQSHSMKIGSIHTHVGSGSDWKIWQKAAKLTLDIVRQFPDVTSVSLGGGYKIDRMRPENSIDFQSVFTVVKELFEDFAVDTGRKLHLEIEPGTYLAANSCLLLTQVNDIVDTGPHGYRFIKTDTSMTELLRPMIYGARHPIRLLRKGETATHSYVVVGSCCESGDIFTPKEADPEQIDTVRLPEAAIGDHVAIMSAGAYGISMSAKNYNSRPICAEVFIRQDGSYTLISKRQKPEEIWEREIWIDF